MNTTANPCRAHVILAQAAPLAVILRRGPSDWVQLIRWQTDTDAIDFGQWFKGRIYERRCDLSPDGRLFLYFARKKNRQTINDPGYTYAWTAVSRPPYFTALALWPKGNCWNGGGYFEANRAVRLNHDPKRLAAHPNHPPHGLTVASGFQSRGEDESIFPQLLRQRGWGMVQAGGPWHHTPAGVFLPSQPVVWHKASPRLGLSLEMHLNGQDRKQFGDDAILSYLVFNESDGATYPLENATWADWDQRGRVVYVAKGLLCERRFEPSVTQLRVIADLNPHSPALVPAPAWASTW